MQIRDYRAVLIEVQLECWKSMLNSGHDKPWRVRKHFIEMIGGQIFKR